MQRSDMIEILRRLANRYHKPPATDQAVDDWHELFRWYDAETMLAAVNKICLECKYMPTPPDLNKAYWVVHNQNKEENRQKILAENANKDCQYCDGTGWFRTIYKTKAGREESYVCECVCRNGDSANLNKALASDDFVWSDSKGAFIPRTGWIGDQEDEEDDQLDIDFDNLGSYVKDMPH